MDYKLELVPLPVSDVDRAKAFYTEKAGFVEDLDHSGEGGFRVVQLTPPGSACSVAVGSGIVDTPPGSVQGLHLVVPDIEAARRVLGTRGGGRRGSGPRRGAVRSVQRPGRERLDPPAAALLTCHATIANAKKGAVAPLLVVFPRPRLASLPRADVSEGRHRRLASRLCRLDLRVHRVVPQQPIEDDGRGPGLVGGAEGLAGERLEVLGEASFGYLIETCPS
jgi:catechol 2,3-dioxygenase-like lactoylglutathione lyase family enzyme